MKVKQLNEILSKLDPELDVYINTSNSLFNFNLGSIAQEQSHGLIMDDIIEQKTIIILRQKPFELGGGE
tara:strand:- start:92 stop:298 length:207 start_codon:yes stop_codon:yes gene_type:complete